MGRPGWRQLVSDDGGRVLYLPGLLRPEQAADLTRFLLATRRCTTAGVGDRSRFEFTHPVIDGRPVVTRWEAAAGAPVWTDRGPAAGAAMPEPLLNLSTNVFRAVGRALDQLAIVDPSGGMPFSSVYVDWYEAGGSFFPHTDRDCYGPIVAGVSIGESSMALRFSRPGSKPLELSVEPNSLYCFLGAVREAPWVHEVDGVTGRRFGITFRQAPLAPAETLEAAR